MYTHVYAGVECITFEKHSTCDYIVLYLHNIPCLCGTSIVLKGLFKEYKSSAAVLQCVEVSKQPLVCNCSGTTEPLLMLSIVLLETFLFLSLDMSYVGLDGVTFIAPLVRLDGTTSDGLSHPLHLDAVTMQVEAFLLSLL